MTINPDAPDRRPLAGSRRAAVPDSTDATPIDPGTTFEVTVVLRRAAAGGIGADPADVSAVEQALTGAGAEILQTDVPGRRVRARGTAAALGGLFGAELHHVTSTAPDGNQVTHRARSGELSLPSDLDGIVVAVLGLDDRPQARSHAHHHIAADANATGYTPLQLATAYDFPAGTDGTGQSIAIIELGGGFGADDLSNYFDSLGLIAPSVTAVSVDGAENQPGGDPNGADGEVLLDIEVAGALAPKATYLVYFAPNTDAGFLDAITEAVHASPTPTAISISWGQSEDAWTSQARTAIDDALTDAVTLGIVVTVAAGDSGSSDTAQGNHVDFPASSPNVLACGGTSLTLDGHDGINAETVWNNASGGATGGGVSDVFAQPSWQAGAGTPSSGRGVPDVAASADPHLGYRVLVDGKAVVVGGTSAVAPLWAALAARLAQARGAALSGFVPFLYTGSAAGTTAAGFHDVTSGSNGSFQAGAGWDACTGLGTPHGTALLARLTGTAVGVDPTPAPPGDNPPTGGAG